MKTEDRTAGQASQEEGASGTIPAPLRAIRPDSLLPVSNLFLWPLLAAASVTQATARFLIDAAAALATNFHSDPVLSELPWATPNSVALELPCMRLRDFSTHTQGQPTLICAPYALHGAAVADFATGHSVVEALQLGGLSRVFVTDWRSATPETRYFSIDSYLADLNVAVDELDHPVDLVGLCQGGWLALVYAARFPGKVRRLVLVGAPVDIRAGESQLSQLAASVPLGAFEELVGLGDGVLLGHRMLELLGSVLDAYGADHVLQVPASIDPVRLHELHERFQQWNACTVDLPGIFICRSADGSSRRTGLQRGISWRSGVGSNLPRFTIQCSSSLRTMTSLSPPISFSEPRGWSAHQRLSSKWRPSPAAI